MALDNFRARITVEIKAVPEIANEQREEIRHLYEELQGYLLQLPSSNVVDFCFDESMWVLPNNTIDELRNVTGKNYDKFKLKPISGIPPAIYITSYKQNLGGLISRLHSEYFANEPHPFQESPSILLNQVIQQNQSIVLQLLLKNEIDSKISQYDIESKESTFLHKLKDSVNSITTFSQFVSMLHKLARELGLSMDDITRIFTS